MPLWTEMSLCNIIHKCQWAAIESREALGWMCQFMSPSTPGKESDSHWNTCRGLLKIYTRCKVAPNWCVFYSAAKCALRNFKDVNHEFYNWNWFSSFEWGERGVGERILPSCLAWRNLSARFGPSSRSGQTWWLSAESLGEGVYPILYALP